MLRPSHRASARKGLRHAVQRNFTDSSNTSGGKTGPQPSDPVGMSASRGTGTWCAQDEHTTTSARESAVPSSTVPQKMQKNRFVGIGQSPRKMGKHFVGLDKRTFAVH